jgi:lipoate-protein ligase A
MQSKPWHLLQSGPGHSAFNMALDEALLQAMPRLGQPVLRFYGWTEPAASFGYFQKYADVERLTLLRPLVRRPTGGGLVPHDADWTYSLAIPPGDPWYSLTAMESYRRVHEWIQAAFTRLSIATDLASTCRKPQAGQCFQGHEQFDVLWRGQKIAGAAQRRTRDGLLIQGSVQPPPHLVSTNKTVEAGFQPASDGRILASSPIATGGRDAALLAGWKPASTVVPARCALQPPPLPLAKADWQKAMCDVACAQYGAGWVKFEPDAALSERAQELALQKYSQASYNQKR